jgi:hypothetical protein
VLAYIFFGHYGSHSLLGKGKFMMAFHSVSGLHPASDS